MNPEDRVSMVRITGRAWGDTLWTRDVVSRMEPRTGDLIVIKVHPARATDFERTLRQLLMPYGMEQE